MLNVQANNKSQLIGNLWNAVADLRWGAPHPPPSGQIFLNFVQFVGKFNKIIYRRPPEGWRPPPCENPGSATEMNCYW